MSTTTRFPKQDSRSEITAPVELTLPDGRLNPAALGWARSPLIRTGGIGPRRFWGRNKRWEYWNIMTPRYIVGLTVSAIDYAAVHEVWIFNRDTREAVHRAATVLPARGVSLPPTLGQGHASARAKDLRIEVTEELRDTGIDTVQEAWWCRSRIRREKPPATWSSPGSG